MSDVERPAATLRSEAKARMKLKELIAAVRLHHPEATKKQIVRASFYALTQDVPDGGEQDQQLHAFALAERASDEDSPAIEPAIEKVRKKDRRKQRAGQAEQAAPSRT